MTVLPLGNDSVVFANGASTSNAIDIGPFKLFALIIPASFAGDTLALTASISESGTYVPVYDDAGDPVTITVGASRVVGVDAAAGALAALRWVKFVSQTAGVAEPQTASRTVLIMAQG